MTKNYDLITEQRLTSLEERIAKLEQQLQEVWPKYGDDYWLFNQDGTIYQNNWDATTIDVARKNFGNCFRTQEEAEAARDKVRELLKGEEK